MPRRLMLLDGSALLYRSFFALQQTALTSSRGLPTGALLGFTNTMLMLARQDPPDFWAVAFDAPGKNFRHELYKEYKANRKRAPDELREQMPWAREVVKAWPCPLLEESGVEADDVLGSIAVQWAGPDLHVELVTGDKDFYQLLSPHVSILNPGRGGASPVEGQRITVDHVQGKFGVSSPDQVIHVLALMGDASDNVPGVAGVGPKTASRLINEYGTLQELYDNIGSLKKGKLRDNLERYRDEAFQSLELVTIKLDLDPPMSLESMTYHPPSGEPWVELLTTLEFKNLVKEFGNGDSEHSAADQSQGTWHLVETKKDVSSLQKKLENSGGFAFEVVADNGDLVGIAFALEDGEAWYVNVAHDSGSPLGASSAASLFGSVFADFMLPKTTHGGKIARRVLASAGIDLQGLSNDTMIGSYLVDPDGSHRLENLIRMQFGVLLDGEDALLGKGKKRVAPQTLSPRMVAEFEGPRVAKLPDLAEHQAAEIEAASMGGLYRDVELPLSDVLRRMEDFGVKVDAGYLGKMSKQMQKQLTALESECHELADMEFNLGSPKQLADVLFNRLKLPTGKKTKTGYSTDGEVLEMLAPHHELPKKILEYRQVSKLKSTYVDALPLLVCERTGRIHAQFNQTVAATGRLSSSDPNLQNIPIRTPLGREVRRAFVAEKGNLLVSADYSQIELRLMAELSQDPVLMEAFNNNLDVHRDTASRIFGVPVDEVTDEQRGQAKTVNFGILYGQGPFGLSKTLGISQAEARRFIDEYKKTYKGVIRYLDNTVKQAYDTGYVSTILNRRRMLPGLHAKPGPARAAAERLAVNAPIQGSAADLIKVAMVNLDHALAAQGMDSRMSIQVHDELLLECPEAEADKAAGLVRDAMTTALQFGVAVTVNVGIGKNWEEIH